MPQHCQTALGTLRALRRKAMSAGDMVTWAAVDGILLFVERGALGRAYRHVRRMKPAEVRAFVKHVAREIVHAPSTGNACDTAKALIDKQVFAERG